MHVEMGHFGFPLELDCCAISDLYILAMDVSVLREFYASRLGAVTRRAIAQRLQALVPNGNGAAVLGLGYANPYLEAWRSEASRCAAFMPARRGVVRWPEDGPAAAALVDEFDLPLVESQVDLALVVHGLELSDDPAEMLAEVWRVLAPQGRFLLVVPNRRGMWARFDSTPFGYGQPFSRPQLSKLLEAAQFVPVRWSHALFMPPVDRGFVVGSAGAIESFGKRFSPGFAGVVIVEATKQVYAVSRGKRARRVLMRLRPVLAPAQARN
jgi:SAM-dependent methyltransferase